MDQTCPVVHKSRRPQAKLLTVTLFYIHCDIYYKEESFFKQWLLGSMVAFNACNQGVAGSNLCQGISIFLS
jgi:hypothetical protein